MQTADKLATHGDSISGVVWFDSFPQMLLHFFFFGIGTVFLTTDFLRWFYSFSYFLFEGLGLVPPLIYLLFLFLIILSRR